MKFTWFFVGECVGAEGGAVEARDGVAEGGEGAADLAVAAFLHMYFVHMRWMTDDGRRKRCNTRLGTGDGKATFAIVEIDAVVGDHLLVEWREWLVELDFVDFCLAEARVGHAVSEIPIVSEHDEA